MDEEANKKLAAASLGTSLLVVAWVFCFIALVVIVARIYVRSRLLNRFKLDDWLIILTYVSALTS